MPKIDGFENDILVVHIGNLYRQSRSEKPWHINVWFNPVQEKKSTTLANLPLLSRGKILNSIHRKENIHDRIITVQPGQTLTPTTLAGFPDISRSDSVRNKENAQNAFSIAEQSANGMLISYIPQLELARAIFLVNSYLCRACLTTTTLQQEFDVQHDVENNHFDIHVLKTANFPLSAFEQGGTRQILAWLLTNHLAMTSYKSIYQHFYKNYESQGVWTIWNFSFEPPPMMNWRLYVRGRFAKDQSRYLVEEIIGIEIDDEMPDSVTFINPNFIKKELNDDSGRGGAGGGKSQNSGSGYEIDDTQTASDQNQTVALEGDLTWVKFNKPSKVTKQNQIKPVSKLSVNKKGEDEGPKKGSTDEAYRGGTLPSVDVGGKQEVTDPEPKCASRFESFNRMLSVLRAKHSCKILSEETHDLPKVGRSQQHLLKCGSARNIKEVRLSLENKEFVLLELDTSDGSKMLSTKILFGVELSNWSEQFKEIITCVVSPPTPLSWPNEKLNSLYGEEGHKGVHHPNKGTEAGDIPLDSLDSWAKRFMSNFLHLSESG